MDGDNGWLPTGSGNTNGWEVSEDFAVNGSGDLVFDEDSDNGTFSKGDVVLLAIQATDAAGIKSDYYLMDITFEA